MATTKKHIAVYLDPTVQQALSDFCEQRGLKSKNGIVYSAGVNTALAEFFGIPVKTISDIPVKTISDIPVKTISDIPVKTISSIPVKTISSIPAETFAVEVLPGKFRA